METELDYKLDTVDTYETVSSGQSFDALFRRRTRIEAAEILKQIYEDSLILDLGCGVGLASLYFWIHGHTVVSAELG